MKPRASDIVRALECANVGLRQRAEKAEQQTRVMVKRVGDLEAELLALKPQIGLPALSEIPFGFSPSENVIFTLLMAREIVSEDAIRIVLYSSRPDDEPGEKVVDMFISKVRQKLTAHGFDLTTRRSIGWFIPRDSKTRIRQVLSKGGMPHAATTALTPASSHTPAPRRPERGDTAPPR